MMWVTYKALENVTSLYLERAEPEQYGTRNAVKHIIRRSGGTPERKKNSYRCSGGTSERKKKFSKGSGGTPERQKKFITGTRNAFFWSERVPKHP